MQSSLFINVLIFVISILPAPIQQFHSLLAVEDPQGVIWDSLDNGAVTNETSFREHVDRSSEDRIQESTKVEMVRTLCCSWAIKSCFVCLG